MRDFGGVNEKHGVVAFDPCPDPLCEPANIVGKGPDPDFFVGTGGEGRVFEGDTSVLVDDGIGEDITVDGVSGGYNIPPLYRVQS